MKQILNKPSGDDISDTPAPSSDKRPVWKVLIFFAPMPSKRGAPTPPGGKGWLEIVLLLLKVIAALIALGKAIGWAV